MKHILGLFLFMLLSSAMMAQAYPDRHSTSWTDSWISCQTSDSPNSKRDPGHWIMYDLGDQYALHGSTIWNFNVPDSTDLGARNIVVDVSDDGVDWTEIGEFTLDEAPASTIFQGTDAIDFGGVVTKYLLISILDNYGDANCVALSEIRVDATVVTSTDVVNKDLNLELTASPNPATTYTTIKIDNPDGNYKYNLTDIKGSIVNQGFVNNGEVRINTSRLTGGVYALSVYNDKGKSSLLITIAN